MKIGEFARMAGMPIPLNQKAFQAACRGLDEEIPKRNFQVLGEF